MEKLTKSFYMRDVHLVAKDLLGKIFVRSLTDTIISGKIVEVEAYDGTFDESAHSFIGKTKRNEVMFYGGGFLYVYFTYGMHFCANVVTGNVNDGCAVLIRSIEPIDGIDKMSLNRYKKNSITEKEKINLTNGPAKICQAFSISKYDNGKSLLDNEIYILNNEPIKDELIATSKRIGIKKSVDLPWRYFIKDNPFVSKK